MGRLAKVGHDKLLTGFGWVVSLLGTTSAPHAHEQRDRDPSPRLAFRHSAFERETNEPLIGNAGFGRALFHSLKLVLGQSHIDPLCFGFELEAYGTMPDRS